MTNVQCEIINVCYIKSLLALPIGKNCKKKSKNTIKETLAENYLFYVMIKVIKKRRRKLHNIEVDNVLK